MIDRRRDIEAVMGLLDRHPVVGIIGARQVVCSTLETAVFCEYTNHYDKI